MTDAEKIELLRVKLEEMLSENDRLRALVANLTEGANAHTVLQSLYRNTDLPEALRAKCAAASLPHEVPKIQSVPPAIDASCEEIIPLADLVTAQRKRADAMLREAREIRVLPNGQVLLLDEHEPSGNGNGGDEH